MRMRNRSGLIRGFALCLCTLLPLLGGCGGGGGGGSGARPPPPAPLPLPTGDYDSKKRSYEQSPEYRDNAHLRLVNAAAAYARGATGAGETIIIMDTGIRDTHWEFAGTNIFKETDAGYEPTNAQKLHGTLVASLAVGKRNGHGAHGVAFDADLHFIEVALDSAPGPGGYELLNLMGYSDLGDVEFLRPALESTRGAIVSFSFGVHGATSAYDREQVRNAFQRTAALLEQASIPDADKKIVVWAAGNARGSTHPDGSEVEFSSPEIYAGLGHYFPELQTHNIAVVALGVNGEIADYSNHCGVAKDFCLAAPGTRLRVADIGSDQGYTNRYQGTSLAAPLISGGLAVLRQYFRGQLGNTELVARLLATANNEGIYADADIYGRGLIDLDAATAPVGMMMTALPGDPDSRPFAGSKIALSGGAFGEALQRGLTGVEVAAFDELGAPFFQSAAGRITQSTRKSAPLAASETRRVEVAVSPYQSGVGSLGLAVGRDGDIAGARLALPSGWWFSYGHHGGRALGLYDEAFTGDSVVRSAAPTPARFSDSLAFAAPYLSLVRDGPGTGWSRALSGGGRLGFALMRGTPQFDGWEEPGGEHGVGVLFDYRLPLPQKASQKTGGLSLQAGFVREADGFLGAQTHGAFGETNGATRFAGINGSWWLGGGWQLLGSAYLGHTRTQADDGGLLRGVDDVLTSAFSVGAARASLWRRDDWFGLRLSQPLRAESGAAKLRLAAGRTRYGEMVYGEHEVTLAPNGRNLQAEAAYHFPIAGGAAEASFGLDRHPQHDRTQGIEPFMRLTWELRF